MPERVNILESKEFQGRVQTKMKLLDTETIVEQLRKKEYEFRAIPIITLIEALRGVKEQKTPEIKN
ncbi:MAG: hypothetical protein QXO71_10895 [Candidatus Jordarchaeaceae archaeon]